MTEPSITPTSEREATHTTSPTRFTRIRAVSTTAWCFVAAQVFVVLPIWVAAWRDGHGGWIPTLDAANTVLRARDVLDGHFPLVGMWSSVSIKLGSATYFPGATELYLLSIPIKLFGNSWGALIGMAVINSFWLLLAGWLLRRRLGTVGATWGLLAFAMLVWTMGSEAIIDVSPMQMITIPFAVFLIAVWSVADRDLGAIPVLALLANFLLLNHLVLTMLVPIIGICAPIGLVVGLRRARRDRTGWPSTRRYLYRQLLISLGVTLVLWLPSLVQQFTNDPGNLTNLWRSTQVDLQRTVSFGKALSVVTTLVLVPPFWFPRTFSQQFSDGPQGIALIVIVSVAIIAFGLLVRQVVKRRDRTSATVLGVAAVAVVAAMFNVVAAPTDFGFRAGYFRSLWATAMFFWLAIGVAIARVLGTSRARDRRHATRLAAIGSVAVLVIALAGAPHADPGSGTNGSTDDSVALSKLVLNRAVVMSRGKGQVRVYAAGDFSSYAVASSLILALDTYGVDVCVAPSMVDQYGKFRACRRSGPDINVEVSSAAFPPLPGEKVIAEATLLTPGEVKRKNELKMKVADWLATQHEIRPSTRVEHTLVNAYGHKATDNLLENTFATAGFPLAVLVYSPSFVAFVDHRSIWHADGSVDPAIKTGSLPPADLVRWANLTQREYLGASVRISIVSDLPEAAFTVPSSSDPYGNLNP